MPGPRAEWFVGELNTDDLGVPDPFDTPVEEIGELIDLSDRKAILGTRVHELMMREGVLFEKDITCKIKDIDGTACSACPVSKARDAQSQLGSLCRIGREQEEVLTEIAALRFIEERGED